MENCNMAGDCRCYCTWCKARTHCGTHVNGCHAGCSLPDPPPEEAVMGYKCECQCDDAYYDRAIRRVLGCVHGLHCGNRSSGCGYPRTAQ